MLHTAQVRIADNYVDADCSGEVTTKPPDSHYFVVYERDDVADPLGKYWNAQTGAFQNTKP